MNEPIQRDLGEQPIARLMAERGVTRRDLVVASNQRVTHKMVARACKGRRLTPHSQQLVLDALNQSAGTTYVMTDVFLY